MTVDVRCTVVTDRGISTTGSISEDHIDTTNVLARVRGTIEFAGIYNMARGTAVNVAYTVPGFNQVTRFPRQLWVLSSKVDPFAEITTTEVGCRLTLMGDLRPPDEVQAADADPELPANMQGQIPLPIYARDVLADCLNKIGLTAAAGNTALVSSFLQEQFDTSAGYVQVINDLLASESCYGFVNAAGQFVVRKIRDAGSVAAVLTRDALLTMEGIEGGPPPADQIRVTWDGAVQSPPGLELPEIPVLPELPEVSSIMINGVAISPEQKATLDAKAAEIAAEQNLPLSIAKGIVYESIRSQGATIGAGGALAASTSQFNDGISGSNVQGASYSDQSRRVDDYNQPGTDDPGNPGTPGGLLNWTYEENISSPQTFRQSYVKEVGGTTVDAVDIVVFASKSVSTTTFEDVSYIDLEGKVQTESVAVTRETITDNCVGPINPTRWKSKLENGSPARAADLVQSRSRTTFDYTPTKDGLRTLQEVTEEYEPIIGFGGRLGIKNWVGIDLGFAEVLVSRTETIYATSETTVFGNSGAPIGSFDRTKTTVNRWLAWGATQEGTHGAGIVAQALEVLEDAPRIAGIYELVDACTALVFDGSEVRISQGRGIVQSLPPRQDQLRDRLTRNTPGGSGFTSLNFSPTGTPTGTARYLLPYPADDTVQGVEVDPVTLQPQVVPGNVQEQARQFGLTQNYLAYGHANGVAITTEIRNLPSEPLGTFCIDAAGVSAVFRSNGQSWAWGPEGMIVGADALLHGTAGTYAAPEFDDCWVPVPVAIDDLVAAASVTTNSSPAPANTITTPGGFDPVNPGSLWGTLPTNGTDVPAQVRSIAVVIEPRNERVAIRATSQTGVTIREYDYPLNLGTEVIQAVTLTSVELPVIVALPLTTIAVGPVAPLVYQPAEITLPLTTVTVTAPEPEVLEVTSVVSLPLTIITVGPIAPDVATSVVVVDLPLTTITVGTLEPTVSEIGPTTDPNFSSVSLLLPCNGVDSSTTFTDASGNAVAITVFNGAKISTTQSKFGGASAFFDGTGDYLRTMTNSTLFDFSSGAFTVELWFYQTGSKRGHLISYREADWRMEVGPNQEVYWVTPFTARITSASGVAPLNQWNHLAAVSDGTTTTLYCNGTGQGTTTSNPFAGAGGSTGIYIGRNPATTARDFNGYMDDIRVTKGVARYTANFTPPTAPFPTS